MKFQRKLNSKWLLVAALIALAPVSAFAAWGAISADDMVGEMDPYFGVGGGDSKAEAMKNAQKFCKEAGGSNCVVLVTYQQCGAYAVSRKYFGTGTGTTKKAAEREALAACNNTKCSVVHSDCND